MTAVPGVDPGTTGLIGNPRGEVLTSTATGPRDPEVVRPVVVEHGWVGSPFPTGRPRCPTCAAKPPPRATNPGHPTPDRHTASWSCQVDEDSSVYAAVVTPDGDLTAAVAGGLHAVLTAAIASGRHIVVNMAHVAVMDSAGLAVLVRAHCHAKQHGAVVCLAAASRFVVTALHTMRLHPVFPVFDDHRHALARLAAATSIGQPSRWLAPRRPSRGTAELEAGT